MWLRRTITKASQVIGRKPEPPTFSVQQRPLVKDNDLGLSSQASTLAAAMQQGIPIIIPCFNTVTYVRGMVDQLINVGLQNIILVDNASSYGPMKAYLEEVDGRVRVVRQNVNAGPRSVFLDPTNFAVLPELFCVTDPDLVFSTEMPRDFIAQLAFVSEREKVGKAGLAIDIANLEIMRDDDFFVVDRHWKIWEWEQQFWEEELQPMPGGDPVFRGQIDTTFALINKKYLDLVDHFPAVRVAGRFTCKHLPWYQDNGLPAEEEAFYRKVAVHSYYLRDNQLAVPD